MTIAERVVALDWSRIGNDLDVHGAAVARSVLSPDVCARLIATYPDDALFRSRVVMGSHGFGRGEYKYFAYPLPDVVAEIRAALYPALAGIANRWNDALRINVRYPDDHAAFLDRCHDAGQTRPTPLLLQYGEGDYNCMHQDVYGEHVFPLQVTFLLPKPGDDFTGGEFVLTEQRPRMQSRSEVVALGPGRRCDLPGTPSPRARHARRVPRQHASWCEPLALRSSPRRGCHLPQRQIRRKQEYGSIMEA